MIPCAKREHHAGQHQPAAPQQHRGATAVGPRCAAQHPQCSSDRSTQRRRQQPGHLGAHLARRTAGSSRSRPTCPRCPATADDAAGLVAGEPAEAVVAEHELEHAVRLRAADVRPVGRRHERDDRDPPARTPRPARHRRPAAGACRRRTGVGAAEQVHQAEHGHEDERLQHLGQERGPDQHATRAPATRCAPARAPASSRTPRRRAGATSSASGLLNRNMSAATGVSASTAPASSPAAGLNRRRTAA